MGGVNEFLIQLCEMLSGEKFAAPGPGTSLPGGINAVSLERFLSVLNHGELNTYLSFNRGSYFRHR